MATKSRDKILIVDDQENNRLVIEDSLRKLKCEIRSAASGEESLSVLKTWIPDIILMDHMMPGLSGVETIKRIKLMSGFEHIPILMVTAKNEVQTLQEAFDAGAVDYILKPVDRITLTARVRSALRTKHAFDEIQELTQELTAQKKELTQFTHMVSHDLKSPVAGAASLFDFFLYRLKDEHPKIWNDTSLQELLIRIPDSLKKMIDFIDTLLNYASAGKVVGELKEEPMDKIIEEVLRDFEHFVTDGIAVVHRSLGMPVVLCDSVKIAQVWQNLIGNAIKYRGNRTPVDVNIGWRDTGKSFQFWVQDNGPGIPPEYREKVFQSFTRLSDSAEGNGIGLATVQRIIHAHKGDIWVASDAIEGAKIVFELPRSTG